LSKASPYKDDQALVEAAKTGDQKAFGLLVAKFRKSIFHVILKIVKNPEDAEDLTFITFSKAFRHIDKYMPTHAFSTWLFKIASNTAIDFLRKNRIQTVSLSGNKDDSEMVDQFFANKIVSENYTPEEAIIHQQRSAIVHQLVEHLDPSFAKVIELRFFKEYSYEEIASELELPLGTVKVQIHRAKKALFEMVKSNAEKI
jgi:RNA polymerase sigma-70 factor (ECF subfamily)